MKSFKFYKKIAGGRVKMKPGGFPEIPIAQGRDLAAKAKGQAVQGIDPAWQRRAVRSSMNLKKLFERYVKEHAELLATERKRVTDACRIKTCFNGWSGRKLTAIRPADVRDEHATIARVRWKVSANRAVQTLRRVFNWPRSNVIPSPEE